MQDNPFGTSFPQKTHNELLGQLVNYIKCSDIMHHINNDNRLMIIMRGPSGCGKTTIARMICKCAECPYGKHIFSTDDKFVDSKEPTRVSTATNENLVLHACIAGISPVIVDNTNTYRSEMSAYLRTAVKNNYIIIILSPLSPRIRSLEKLYIHSRHGITNHTIKHMLSIFEEATVDDLILELQLKYSEKLPQKSAPRQRSLALVNGVVDCYSSADHDFVEAIKVCDDLLTESFENLSLQNDNATKTEMTPHVIGCAHENPDFRILLDHFPTILADVLWKQFKAHNGDCNRTINTIYNWSKANYAFALDDCQKVQFICDCALSDEIGTESLSEPNIHNEVNIEKCNPAASQSSENDCTVDTNDSCDFKEDTTVEVKMEADDNQRLNHAFAHDQKQEYKKDDLSECFAKQLVCFFKAALRDSIFKVDITTKSCGATTFTTSNWKNGVWGRTCHYDVETNIKINDLYKIFPTVDKVVVWDILYAFQYCVDSATEYIAKMLKDEQLYAQTNVQESPTNNNQYNFQQFGHGAQFQLQHGSDQNFDCGALQLTEYFQMFAPHHDVNTICTPNNMAMSSLIFDQFLTGKYMTLDLHNMLLKEAKMTVELFLNAHIHRMSVTKSKMYFVSVITGWGKHTNGISPIKKYVGKYCLSRGLRCEQENVGMFKVNLLKNSQTIRSG